MRLLVSGANGYIGLRLVRELIDRGHEVLATVRDKRRFPLDDFAETDALRLVEVDFLDEVSCRSLPGNVDAAFYLLHSMGSGAGFASKEETCALNFAAAAEMNGWRRIIYLGGLGADREPLSAHLASRRNVESVLDACGVPLTVLRASIIVGSGSASFEIIRDLAEKLPLLVTPRWVKTRCQPIAIRNVLGYLAGCAEDDRTAGRTYDIGGPEVLAYVDLIRRYAKTRGLKRFFLSTRVLSPRLSSWWLVLLTSTSFPIARALVDSMTHETVCHDEEIRGIVPQELLTYQEAVERALSRIAQNRVPSSWTDALAAGTLDPRCFDAVKAPEHGVYQDTRSVPLDAPMEEVKRRIWSIGGHAGWPSMNWAWKIRGALDKIVGGTGLRRGRRHPQELRPGDALDFWRVILADRKKGRLLLYAEMRLPGEAWLEFSIEDLPDGRPGLRQTATFRPQGLFGRLYWFSVLPFHFLLFPRMIRRLAQRAMP